MALTRKFLEALGIEQAKIDEIISAHTEVTDSLKADRDSYKEKAEKYDEAKTELDKAKSELDKVNKDEYKNKYESLEAEFNKYKTDIAEKEVKVKKEEAYKKMLKEIGVNEKSIGAILKVKDLSSLKLDDKGNIVDVDTLKESEKKDWEGFIIKSEEERQDPNTPPDHEHENVDTTSMSMDDYIKARSEGRIK